MRDEFKIESGIRTRFNNSFSKLVDEISLSYNGLMWIKNTPKERFLRAGEALKIEHNFTKLWDRIYKNTVDQVTHCDKLYELRSKVRSFPQGQIESLVDGFIAGLPAGRLQTEFQGYRDEICLLLRSDLALDKKN